MTNGKTNKRKGSDAERYYAAVFRKLGYDKCVTARLGSRMHDNAKIDLIFAPFNIQIKGGTHKNMNPGKVLLSMDGAMKAIFPEGEKVFEYPKILIHRRRIYVKSNDEDTVYMSLQQFESFKELDPSLEYDTIKEAKYINNSEFRTIVSITFKDFKEKVVPHFPTL